MRGLPETPKDLKAIITVDINRETFEIERIGVQDWGSGDWRVYRPFEVIPPVSVSIDNAIEIFVDNTQND